MRASGADALIAESEESGMTRFKAQIAGRSLRVSDTLNFMKRENQILQDYNPGGRDLLNRLWQTKLLLLFQPHKDVGRIYNHRKTKVAAFLVLSSNFLAHEQTHGVGLVSSQFHRFS